MMTAFEITESQVSKMSVLMSKGKADAIRSVERDKYLLTDRAAEQRIDEGSTKAERVTLSKTEKEKWIEARMWAGK